MSTPTDTQTVLGDGGDATRVLAGDCTVVYDGDAREEHRGHVTVLLKPDNTVLVHDADGYQPVAWLTRADAVSCSRGRRRPATAAPADVASNGGRDGAADGSRDGANNGSPDGTDNGSQDGTTDRARRGTTGRDRDGTGRTRDGAAFAVDAQDGDAHLRITAHTEDGYGAYPATAAGRPVGSCPDCDGTLVRAGRAVSCIGCGTEHGLPDGASVREERCECGLPRVRVERGVPLDVCLDRSCEPLLDAVRERFDREWSCPDCGSDLRVLSRGRLLAGCEAYPDCEVAFSIPNGTVVDDCDCGLPVFETSRGRRCLDTDCEHW